MRSLGIDANGSVLSVTLRLGGFLDFELLLNMVTLDGNCKHVRESINCTSICL